MEIPDFIDLKKQNKTSTLKIEEIQKLDHFKNKNAYQIVYEFLFFWVRVLVYIRAILLLKQSTLGTYPII